LKPRKRPEKLGSGTQIGRLLRVCPPRLKAALLYYIETGDIRRAAFFAGLDLEDFRELMRRANVPLVV